ERESVPSERVAFIARRHLEQHFEALLVHRTVAYGISRAQKCKTWSSVASRSEKMLSREPRCRAGSGTFRPGRARTQRRSDLRSRNPGSRSERACTSERACGEGRRP